MQTNPAVEQNKNIKWPESRWNQSGKKGKGLWKNDLTRLPSYLRSTTGEYEHLVRRLRVVTFGHVKKIAVTRSIRHGQKPQATRKLHGF